MSLLQCESGRCGVETGTKASVRPNMQGHQKNHAEAEGFTETGSDDELLK